MYQSTYAKTHDPAAIESGKIWAVLCYLPISPVNWILSIVCLVQRNNAFSLYHAKQAMALIIASLVCTGLPMLALVLSWMNVVEAKGVFVALSLLAYLALAILFFVLAILGIVNAASGRYAPLPLVDGIAEKLFGSIRTA